MATIDREQLLEDVKFWLPPTNTISDVDIIKLCELIITQVSDDNENYIEVLCKSIKLVAQKNASSLRTSNADIKVEKLGPLQKEFYQSSNSDIWNEWLIKDYPKVCTNLGYSGSGISKPIGIYISPGEDISIDDMLAECSYNT